MARHPDKVKLLFGLYTPPLLRKGDPGRGRKAG
jgi:hypothetical protein